MKKRKSPEREQRHAAALQYESDRLAGHVRERHAGDAPASAKRAKRALVNGRQQLRRAADEASDSTAAALAGLLERVAAKLRTYAVDSPASQLVHSTADSLEHSSERLVPWGRRSVVRRLTRAARASVLPAVLVALSAAGTAYLLKRGRPRSH